MATLTEAKETAKGNLKDMNYCMEYTDAYVFSCQNNDALTEGCIPVVVLKDTGKIISMGRYAMMSSCMKLGEYAV